MFPDSEDSEDINRLWWIAANDTLVRLCIEMRNTKHFWEALSHANLHIPPDICVHAIRLQLLFDLMPVGST
jgi:hypothetical protein